MRRVLMLLTLALLVGSGVAVAASQSEQASTPEVGNAVLDESGCATPMASPSASPGATASVVEEAADMMATPEDGPGVVDPCATPPVGTPES